MQIADSDLNRHASVFLLVLLPPKIGISDCERIQDGHRLKCYDLDFGMSKGEDDDDDKDDFEYCFKCGRVSLSMVMLTITNTLSTSLR